METVGLILIVLIILQTSVATRVGTIRNALLSTNCSLSAMNASTCETCLCAMINQSRKISIFSFNCLVGGNKAVNCELFTTQTYGSPCFYRIRSNLSSTYYFRELPVISAKTLLWTFDNTLDDLSGQFTGTAQHWPSFAPGINGYGSALSLNGSLRQCVVVIPYLNMSNISFTWEFWVYPTKTPSFNSMFIGQCNATPAADHCLHIQIRNHTMYFGFWQDDTKGTTPILANQWSHMAYVYNLTTNEKSIYLNGILEITKKSRSPLQVKSTSMTFGCLTGNGGKNYDSFFTGYIDQMIYNSHVKNAAEILDDATLVFYYRFRSNASLVDSGPNHIEGSWSDGVEVTEGVDNQALNFSVNGSYFSVTGLVLLGISDRPFSLSLWFKTISLNGGGTLAHLSSFINGTGWCLGFMGLTSTGNITIVGINASDYHNYTGPVMPINSWNHAVYTYSITNGMRLYVNGTLDGSVQTPYTGSGVTNTLTFGNPRSGTYCASSHPKQQFYGSIDEVRLYSRELNTSEVSQLYSNV